MVVGEEGEGGVFVAADVVELELDELLVAESTRISFTSVTGDVELNEFWYEPRPSSCATLIVFQPLEWMRG